MPAAGFSFAGDVCWRYPLSRIMNDFDDVLLLLAENINIINTFIDPLSIQHITQDIDGCSVLAVCRTPCISSYRLEDMLITNVSQELVRDMCIRTDPLLALIVTANFTFWRRIISQQSQPVLD